LFSFAQNRVERFVSNHMVGMEEHNLFNMETLLFQSAQGIHLLFDNDSIAQVLGKPQAEEELLCAQNMDIIQEILIRLMEKKSLREKKLFLRSLDRETYELLMRTYFHIVDNAVLASTLLKH